MYNSYVKLQPDLFGNDPNNYIAQKIELVETPDFPYYIFSPFQGGFYLKDIELFDKDNNLLKLNEDYVASYYFNNLSQRLGLDVFQAIIIINPLVKEYTTLEARYVGGDVAYSLSVVQDYVNYWKEHPHVPYTKDYSGYEPSWAPGELDQIRWGGDLHGNLDYALFELSQEIDWSNGDAENKYRQKFDQLSTNGDQLNNDLQNHINDFNNPHKLTKESVNLNYLFNYPVATYTQLYNNEPEFYVTPAISVPYVQVNFTEPYKNHTTILGNPHNFTAEDYGSYSYNYVLSILNDKWLVSDTANNAELLTNENTNYSSNDLVTYLNNSLKSKNFVDFIPIDRLGSIDSTLEKNKVVLTNLQTWEDLSNLNKKYENYLGYAILTLSGEYASRAQAATAANQQYAGIVRGLIKCTIIKNIVTTAGSDIIRTTSLLNYNNGSWS